jgi:oxygen-independent coproporphyrinogen-3 oxidase
MPDKGCKENRELLPRGPAAALYVHVPFCRRKCAYCDFYSVPFVPEAARRFVGAARAELDRRRGQLAAPLASVFVGGGTPTVLGARLLEELLGAVGEFTDARSEFTVEANPGTLDGDLAGRLAALGVNRVSVGAQSFDAGELRLLGRVHTPREVPPAVEALRRAGIANIALDLMYGIPGQTLSSWRATLAATLDLAPDHLSCYALSFEPATPLDDDRRAGRLREMADDDQRRCFDAAVAVLTAAGFEHYEISNFARPGRRCRHNVTYWRNEPYVGIGPAATSYVDGVRATTRADVGAYASAVLSGGRPASSSERLGGRRAMAETLMLGLRMTEGVSVAAFTARFGCGPQAAFPRSISRHARSEALLVTPQAIRLAPDAMFVSDTILADILDEA